MEDYEKFGADMKFVIKVSRDSANLFEKVQKHEVKWYHAIYDKTIVAVDQQFKREFHDYMAVQKRLQFDLKLQKGETLQHQDQIKFGMLTVAGHLYAEVGRMIKIDKKMALIKFVLSTNIVGLFTIFAYIFSIKS